MELVAQNAYKQIKLIIMNVHSAFLNVLYAQIQMYAKLVRPDITLMMDIALLVLLPI